MRYVGLATVFILFYISEAMAASSFDKPVKTMAFVNGSLMASPVMPISFASKKGRNRFSVRPSFFEADSGLQEHDGARWKAKFAGKGLAIMYQWQIFDRAGLYVLGMYNQLDSGEFLGRGNDPSDPQQDVISRDVSANFLQTSLGANISLLNFNNLALELLVGPTFTKANAEQRVVQEDPSNPDEFIMKLSPTVFGTLLGLQLGIKFSEWFAINPYFMISTPLGDKCVEYDLTIIQSGDQTGLSDRACDTGGGKPQVEYDTSFSTLGLNVLIPRLGLSVNAFVELEDIKGIEGTDPTLYYVTFTF